MVSCDRHQCEIVPLVMHRVTKDEYGDFEDVRIMHFDFLLSQIGNHWITLEDCSNTDGCTGKKYYYLTFDDGYFSDYEIVFPRLQQNGVKACFFLIANSVGKKGFLDWSHVREMHKEGMEFGSHSMNHKKMTTLSTKQAVMEFVTSRQCLEDKLGERVTNFSFPYGSYNKRLIDQALECGYESCFVSNHGIVKLPAKIIPRNSINGSMNKLAINKIIQASLLTRACWVFEDVAKNTSKKLVGDSLYTLLRNRLS